MKSTFVSFMLSLGILFNMCGCGNFNYEHRHVDKSMMLWAARGSASRDELTDAVSQAIASTPGVANVLENYPTSTGEIVWPNGSGQDNKIWFKFDFGNGNAEERGIYFTAIYFAGSDSGAASTINAAARQRMQNLLNDVQQHLGRNAMKSTDGVIIR